MLQSECPIGKMLQNECPFRNDVTKWMSNWKWCYKMSVQSEMMLQNECSIRVDVSKWVSNQKWCHKISVQSEIIIQNEGPIRYDVTKFGRNTCLQYTHTYLLMEQLNNEYSKSVDYKLTRRNLVNVDRYKVTLTRPLGIFHIDVWRIVISTCKYLKWINQQMLLDPLCEKDAFTVWAIDIWLHSLVLLCWRKTRVSVTALIGTSICYFHVFIDNFNLLMIIGTAPELLFTFTLRLFEPLDPAKFQSKP